jgi:pyruvate ferredoxin oxidoreductase gamma subunit
MIELRFLGRGGQGAVLAAELLARAAFEDGKVPQSFPFFGVERRGAPVTAFTRISDGPIGVRTSITDPDLVVVLEHGLLSTPGALQGLKEGGWLLVNSSPAPGRIIVPPGVHLATVDATAIALRNHLGTPSMPIVNTAILGALARVTGVVSFPALIRAIEANVPRQQEENLSACRVGFDQVRFDLFPTFQVPARPAQADGPLPDGPMATRPSDVIRTASWRTLRPVVHVEKCTRCNFCWKFCPEPAISFDAQGFPVISLDHCKGCGICAEVCPPHTIAMVAEEA